MAKSGKSGTVSGVKKKTTENIAECERSKEGKKAEIGGRKL